MVLQSVLLCTLALSAQPSPTKPFVSREHGLEMQIPNDWKAVKERVRQVITFTTAAGPARVEVFASKYLQPAADWQNMHKTVNEQMQRKVDRQWEEEILGVPMLLTKVTYTEPKEGDVGVLIGLLYSKASDKFHFRMVVPRSGYDEAETAWRTALLTLRTTTGQLPAVEDGRLDNIPKPPPVQAGQTINLANQPQKTAPLGPVKVPFTVGNRSGVMRFDRGITTEGGNDFQIKVPGLPESVRASVYNSVDSPASGLYVMQEANKDLNRFTTVTSRQNMGPKRSSVGNQIFSVVRSGQVTGATVNTFLGVIDAGDFYLVMRFESGDVKSWDRYKRTLDTLLERTGFERKP